MRKSGSAGHNTENKVVNTRSDIEFDDKIWFVTFDPVKKKLVPKYPTKTTFNKRIKNTNIYKLILYF